MYLSDFTIIRPPFEVDQERSLEWILEAHIKSEGNESLRQSLKEKLLKVCCKKDRIEKRGHVLLDYQHLNWEKMQIFNLHENKVGKSLADRSKIYEEHVEKVFSEFYETQTTPPDDLIHVSCTGYVSPSGAQRLISKKNWGSQTTVTHCYHMGCYASIPALRMAKGFLHSDNYKNSCDIVHTEICSLHSNPSLHRTDQLVSQSLFADGFIKYTMNKESKKNGLKLLCIQEEIIPNCPNAMTWNTMDWGFEMYLAKEVPVFITRHLKFYLERLSQKYPIKSKPFFAVHPGGPKILKYVEETLNLTPCQLQFSYDILKSYGNMSSATLPHIWEKILKTDDIPKNTPIISLAFGPGLTIAGALFEKV